MPGTIYLVATPIGNLEDLSPRGLAVLRQVDRIACEDTRHSGKLLAHFGVDKPLVSYHEHNEQQRAAELVERVRGGESIAIISDAGMPGISDPGYRVVRAAIESDIAVVPIPGPTAIETALAASGMPTDRFRFEGFLPAKMSARRKVLEGLRHEEATTVFYETPRRIRGTLADVAELLGARPVVVARELTKLHEEFLRGTAAQVAATLEQRTAVKGEITLLIGGGAKAKPAPEQAPARVAELVAGGADRMTAIKQAARECGLPKSEVYRMVEQVRPGTRRENP